MTAATGIARQPRLRVRTAAVAMTATFLVGVIAGLVVPQVRLPSGAVSTGAVSASNVERAQAYQEYRRGERDLLAAEKVVEEAWQAYRAGERGDPTTP
jgi:hypothetical protein